MNGIKKETLLIIEIVFQSKSLVININDYTSYRSYDHYK